MDFPARVAVRATVDLKVRLTCEPARPGAAALDFLPRQPDRPFEVDLYLMYSPDDFELKGDFHRKLTVPVNGDTRFEAFRLRPLSAGPKLLTVVFHHGGQYVGEASVRTEAVEAGPTRYGSQAALMGGGVALGIHPPDVSLIITLLEERNFAYRFQVFSPDASLMPDNGNPNEPAGWTVRLNAHPEAYVAELFKSLNAWAAQSPAAGDMRVAQLESKGSYLYEKLFPPAVKRWYWEKMYPRIEQQKEPSLSFLIVSNEPLVPWEIVRPAEPRRQGKFLCEAFILSRWIAPESLPRDQLNLSRLGLLAPLAGLEMAQTEAMFLRRLLGPNIQTIPANLQDLLATLQEARLGGLHVASHGSFQAEVPELSSVRLNNDVLFTPDWIVGDYKTLFSEAHPLVFLNACDSSQQGFALSGLGGWASALLGAGAGAFLGSTWRVADDLAYHFAEVFYQSLCDRRPLGQAVVKARSCIRDERPGNPSWLGYSLFGHPAAEVTVGSPAN